MSNSLLEYYLVDKWNVKPNLQDSRNVVQWTVLTSTTWTPTNQSGRERSRDPPQPISGAVLRPPPMAAGREI